MNIGKIVAVVGMAVAGSIAAAPSTAHHSFGRYDMTKTSGIEGAVRKFEWSNPHCWLFVDVASADGASVTYGFEMQSVGEMMRRGWKKTSVKPGDKVKVSFRPLRDGAPAGLITSVNDADDKPIGVWTRATDAESPPAE